MNVTVFCLSVFLFAGCSIFSSNNYAPLETVPSVDVKKYIGKWYEIASLPFSRQEGCSCTTAEYDILDDGVLSVTNRCKKGDGFDQAVGKAFVIEGTNNTKLKVQFFWPFKGDYWVIDLAEDYSYAVVGMPSRKYCWILSRTKTMSDETYAGILERVKAKGFDITRFNKTAHDCQ
ncbi:MAG: lipocalin family protein [Bacteroidota bacterium]